MKRNSTDLREQLGQLLVIGFDGTSVDAAVKKLLARIRPAGVILFTRNLVNPAQVKQLTFDLQSYAKELGIGPLLIGIDHEGGAIVRMGPPVTRFPGNMALVAAGSLDLAYQQARAMAEELLAMGINWDFAPCIDVNSNPLNPIIGVRSFGDDPNIVSEFGVTMIDGFQSSGLIACAKHFPGHGDTAVDSHLGLPVVSRPLEEVRKVELPPFQAAVNADVATIMTAHVVFSELEPERPATVSRRIITDLLRDEMGYDGVVVSDALEMAGLADSIGVGAGAVGAVNAGVDLMLACNSAAVIDEAFVALQQSYDNKDLDLALVERAFERVARLKLDFLGIRLEYPLAMVGDEEHRTLEAQIAAESITLVRDDRNLLPIAGQTVGVTAVGVDEAALEPLKEALRGGCEVADDYLEAELQLIVSRDLPHHREEVAQLRDLTEDYPQTILLMVGYPGDLQLLPETSTVLATYSSAPASLRAAATVMLGQADTPGRLPLLEREES